MNTCPTCGTNISNARYGGWDNLRSYEFNIYPDTLVVVTNAPLSEFQSAVDAVREGEKNIDAVLQERGYIAIAAINTGTVVTL